jgi:hypothetical protein
MTHSERTEWSTVDDLGGGDKFVIIVLFSCSLSVVFPSPKSLPVPEAITRLLLSTLTFRNRASCI